MKDKCLVITSAVCMGVCFIVAIFGLAFMKPLLISFVQDNSAMLPQTQTLWGQVPGDTGTQVIRKFTFYNFENPMGYLFRNQTPKFVEKRDYTIQELSSMLNYTYNKDQSEVSFNYWLHFQTRPQSRNLSDRLRTIHAAPLGFWGQLDTMNASTFTIQGLGPLYIQLNKTFKSIAIGQGVAQQFLPDVKTFNIYCQRFGFDDSECFSLWNDPSNGLSDGNRYQVWVRAAFQKDQESRKYLLDYFPYSPESFNELLSQIDQWCQPLNLIINNQYCDGRDCTSAQLAIKQISSSAITSNPPAGMAASISFCDQNSTCKGYYPQISAFVHKKMYAPFDNYTFSQQNFTTLFTPGKGLLHIGNLQKLWEWGNQYDKEFHPKYQPTPSQFLQKIQIKFLLESQQHAFIFWQWIKYFTNDFVLKKSLGGGGKIAGFGGLVAGSLYESLSQFGDWVVPDLRAYLASQEIKQCNKYIRKLFDQVDKQNDDCEIETLELICQQIDPSDYRTYIKLFKPCLENEAQVFEGKREQLQYYCDQDQPSIVQLLTKIDNQISEHYQCQGKCSPFVLALKQMVNSTVSLNPITQDYAQVSLTAKDINQKLQAFEYQYFVKQIKQLDTASVTLSQTQLRQLFSFDKLFSAPMVSSLLLMSQQQFRATFYWDDPKLFKDYLRYVLFEIGFVGFTIQTSASDLIYGYNDPFLVKLGQLSPLQGGDPSVPSWVAFNQPNMKKDQAYTNPQTMNTGKTNVDDVRQYVQVLGQNFITYNRSWFDGDNIGWSLQNPWKQKVKFNGTDSIQNKPNFQTTDKISVYLTTIWRGGQLEYNRTVERFGIQLYEMKIDQYMLAAEQDYKYNNIFYQGFGGFLNLSFQGLPLFVSKNHFYSAPSNWSELVQFYDEDNNKQEPNQYDDTTLLIEPYSGASFFASIYLQTNYYSQPDILFQPSRRMLPIFSLYRSGNISESAIDQYFGPLKTGIWMIRGLFIIGSIFLIVIAVHLIARKMHKRNKTLEKKDSLLESVEAEQV